MPISFWRTCASVDTHALHGLQASRRSAGVASQVHVTNVEVRLDTADDVASLAAATILKFFVHLQSMFR